ncbi:unnamed protein product [Larinioides sclopetarius]|uniref:Rac GTPase-activating protein 1 n=1 Tax=Larinioides sclopetarius TaxID=280406 RepID=A0AAV2AYU6_9ARAC
MASDNVSGLSLVAQFDDICRFNKVLITGCESEFKHFVEVSKTHLKLNQAQAKISELERTVNTLEMEKKGFEGQIKQLNQKWLETKKIKCIQDILGRGKPVDAKTKEQVNRLLCDVSCAKKQPFARPGTIDDSIASLLSSSDYDDTVEKISLNISYQQKRSSTGDTRGFDNHSFGKRAKFEKSFTSQFENTRIPVPDLQKIDKVPEVERCLNVQSSSELSSSVRALTSTPESDYEPVESSGYNLRNRSYRRNISSYFQSPSSPGEIFSQGHSFTSKSAFRYEKCYSCEKAIILCKQALKCNNCKITCHPECKDLCPATCIRLTPCSKKGSESTISDFTSTTSSMIPSLITHCVNEIESRGLKDVGLYRISGVEKEVKEVKEKLLKGKNLIQLNKTHIHVLCGVIKSFLRSLKEPLIPTSAWQSFVEAAEIKDKNRSLHLLYNHVCDLPQPNKETLAFLLQHFQRVSESTICQMPIDNLASILGPTIVGYSSPSVSNAKLLRETSQQRSVMKKLLMLPSVCWQTMLDKDLSATSKKLSVISAIKASDSVSGSNSSRNEPRYASVQKDRVKARKDKNFLKSP